MVYRAIDLFAGIGGIRLGFEQAFGKKIEFIFASEIDDFCKQTYKANFGETPHGDITMIPSHQIPDFDILMAGTPCQSFSIAGEKRGFDDTRGTMFYEVARILRDKRPEVFFLENVAHLQHHDGGRTFKVIRKVLEMDLGYCIHYKILNARDYGVPQNRPRIYIVGFYHNYQFRFPKSTNPPPQLRDIVEQNVDECYYVSHKHLLGMKRHKANHQAQGHGFGYQVLEPKGVASALVVGGMGRERNLIQDIPPPNAYRGEGDDPLQKCSEGIRYMTERECARVQGFPEAFKIPVSRNQAYRQFANSVPVPVVKQIAERIHKTLRERVVRPKFRQRSLSAFSS